MRTNRPKTPISVLQESLPKLIDKGLSDKKIADMFGLSETTVRNHRKKMGIVNKKRNIFKSKPLRKKDLVQLIKDKWLLVNSAILSNDPDLSSKAIDSLKYLYDQVNRPSKRELIITPLKVEK